MKMPVILLFCGVLSLVACTREPPPRSVQEFLDNPILLEAALVRCSRDRDETRYHAECVNAREANKQIAAEEEAARRAELEARSERKRQALRRTQEAAAEARRRASEAERLRKEAEYLAQFGELPPPGADDDASMTTGNVPIAVVPEASGGDALPSYEGDTVPASDGGNAPVVEQADEPASDIQAIREELKRRDEESGN